MKSPRPLLIAGFALVAAVPAFFGSGCASSTSGNVYSRETTRRAQEVQTGTVQSVDAVEIQGERSGVGAVAGGAAGGVAGSTIGRGSGSTLAAVGGALAGAAAGAFAEEEITGAKGQEITVQLESGKTIVVVQEADTEFQPGDRVRVITAPDGTTRVRY